MSDGAFRRMVDGSLQAKLVHRGGRPLYANPACARLYGFDSVEALLARRTVSDLIGTDPAPLECQREAIHRTRDGRSLHVLVMTRPIEWEGAPATQCAIVDMEPHMRAEEALSQVKERYDLAVKGSAVGIWDQDRRNGGCHWSERMRRILGVADDDERPPREVFLDLLHPDDHALVRAATRQAFETRGLYAATYRVIRPEGSVRWVQATGRALHDVDGRVLRFAGSAQDVTADKEREAELVAARARAEAEARGRSRFVSLITHEVRTPLNAIIGAADLLAGTALDPTQRALLVQARSSSAALLAMVQDVLDLNRLDGDGLLMQVGATRLDRILEEEFSVFSRIGSDKGLALTLAIEPRARAPFLADGAQWRRVARHLLDNAVKFTRAGRVDARLEVGDAGRGVRLVVTDTGPGIADDHAKAVFEPFVQVDSSIRRGADGAGVGLALARRLARTMGGDLTMSTTPGEGSSFRFDAPFEMAAAEPAPLYEADPQALHVLVAEDNAANRRVIGLILEKLGHVATFACDGREAVAAHELAAFDVILMDLHMPEMDGYQATRLIRAREGERGGRVPIAALTADARTEARDEALAAGMDDFLTKPIDVARLADTLERLARTNGAPASETTSGPASAEPEDRSAAA